MQVRDVDPRGRLIVLMVACSVLVPGARVIAGQTVAADHSLQAITFAKDIAPILQEKCEACHRVGSMAPMPLVTYDEVRPWLRSIRTRVANREMPPWLLDRTVGIQKFRNDRSLTDQQLETLLKWIDSGGPRGDDKDMPPPKQWPAGDHFELEATLGPPDLIVRGQPWTEPAEAQDITLQGIPVEIPITEPRYVRATETKPSLQGRRIAHHATTALIEPDRDPDDPAAPLFSEWAQGKGGEVYPANTGKLVKPGTKVRFDVHYHAVGEEITNTVEIAWWFYPKGVIPKYKPQFMALGNMPDLQIPPNTVTQHVNSFTLPEPAMLHNFQPHMHYRGKALKLEAIYPDGKREVVNYVDRYNNSWHINYIYAEDAAPVFPKGTVLQITAWHDNTSANKNNPDPRQWVSAGGRTIDEMAHSNTQIIYISEEDYQRISAERKKATPQKTDQQ
jgi:hypothetical protein